MLTAAVWVLAADWQRHDNEIKWKWSRWRIAAAILLTIYINR